MTNTKKNEIIVASDNFKEIKEFLPNYSIEYYTERCPNGKFCVIIKNLKGDELIALKGDYIVKNKEGFITVMSQSNIKTYTYI